MLNLLLTKLKKRKVSRLEEKYRVLREKNVYINGLEKCVIIWFVVDYIKLQFRFRLN